MPLTAVRWLSMAFEIQATARLRYISKVQHRFWRGRGVSGFSLKNRVTVHYTGSFDDGEVFDTTEGREPLAYVEGAHEVVPGFEAAVAGMQPGEKKHIHLEPKDTSHGF